MSRYSVEVQIWVEADDDEQAAHKADALLFEFCPWEYQVQKVES